MPFAAPLLLLASAAAAPDLARPPSLVDALGAWHTRYAILGTTGTIDFFRTRSGCLVGLPRDGGASTLRCGGSPVVAAGQVPPAELEGRLAGQGAAGSAGWPVGGLGPEDWVGAWREVRLVELVPIPGGGGGSTLAAEGAAAWDGATGVYGWKRVLPPSMTEARWIDWSPPPELDGTCITLSARVDPRYAAAAAALDAAILSAVARHLRGEALPTGLAEVPGGPLGALPSTHLALSWVVFLEGPLGGVFDLPMGFRELDLPVALLNDPVRYESRLPLSRARLLLTVSRWGASAELGAPGADCEPSRGGQVPRACRRPAGSVERVEADITLPLRREGAAAAPSGAFSSSAFSPDAPLTAARGARRRQWVLFSELRPSARAWAGAEALIVLGPSAPFEPAVAPPPAPPGEGFVPRVRRPAPAPPPEAFPAPASAALRRTPGGWRVRAQPSAFPIGLPVRADEPVTIEVVAFSGSSPPFPRDEPPGPAQVFDARAPEGWVWRFTGERPRWVRLSWKAGERLLATAILPV